MSWQPAGLASVGRACHRLEQAGAGSSPTDACHLLALVGIRSFRRGATGRKLIDQGGSTRAGRELFSASCCFALKLGSMMRRRGGENICNDWVQFWDKVERDRHDRECPRYGGGGGTDTPGTNVKLYYNLINFKDTCPRRCRFPTHE